MTVAADFGHRVVCPHCGRSHGWQDAHTCPYFCASCGQSIKDTPTRYMGATFCDWNCVAGTYLSEVKPT